MSKQEVFEILYEVITSLPRELILLIREYILFLPTALEFEYKVPDKYKFSKMVVLASTRFLLFGWSTAPSVWENGQVKQLFQPNCKADIHDIIRKSDNSFLISHNNVLEEIAITVNEALSTSIPFKRTRIYTFHDANSANKILIDKDGDVIVGGYHGIYVIRGEKIIQHLLEDFNCSLLLNSFKIYSTTYVDNNTRYILSKQSDKTYTTQCIPDIMRMEDDIFEHLRVSSYSRGFEIYNEKTTYATVTIADNANYYTKVICVLNEKIYIKRNEAIKIYRCEYYQ